MTHFNQKNHMFLLNAFSLNMLPSGSTSAQFREVGLAEAQRIAQNCAIESAVGHADTAAVFATLLGIEVPVNRVNVSIPARTYGVPHWKALVGQYSGPRLPEGASTLPEGASIKWFSVWVE